MTRASLRLRAWIPLLQPKSPLTPTHSHRTHAGAAHTLVLRRLRNHLSAPPPPPSLFFFLSLLWQLRVILTVFYENLVFITAGHDSTPEPCEHHDGNSLICMVVTPSRCLDVTWVGERGSLGTHTHTHTHTRRHATAGSHCLHEKAMVSLT